MKIRLFNRKIRPSTWVAFGLILMVAPIIYFTLSKPGSVRAEWFDDSYQYREQVTFGNTGAADSNKKVKLDVDTQTLITNGKMQSDCDDIRFTDAGGKVLQYYFDSATGACNTSSSDFWVLVPTITGNGTTVLYMYYGNPQSLYASQTTQIDAATFSPTSGPTFGSEEKSSGPVVFLKFDEGVDKPSARIEQQINLIDQSTTTTSTTYTPTDYSLGLSEWDSANYSSDAVYFEAIMKNTNGTGDVVGGAITPFAMDCSSSDNCKIVYINTTDNDVYFMDCDDEQCLTGTKTLLDGGAGCAITNCSSSYVINSNSYIDMSCAGGSDNCKIVYRETSGSPDRAIFIDCDNEACSAGTLTILDGQNCVLTNCQSAAGANDGIDIEIDCRNGTVNCKIAYIEAITVQLKFVDCDNETCSSGTVNANLDGDASCDLTGCTGADVYASGEEMDLFCPSATNCKIAYRAGVADVYFADCDNETCSGGTSTMISGNIGCSLTGCNNTTAGVLLSLYCVSSIDCKIAQLNGSNQMMFDDCDDETCSTGTENDIDGYASSTLSGAESLDVTEPSVYCLSSGDCKIAYYGDEPPTSERTGLKFADCSDETCSGGTTSFADGYTGCNLTDCVTSDDNGDDPVLICLTADNCKIAYGDTTNGNLKFADCDNVDCTSGTVYTIDTGGTATVALYSSGGTAVTNAEVSTVRGSWTRVRSPLLTQGTLPSLQSAQNYTVRLKSDDGANTTAAVAAARLIAVQGDGATRITDIRTDTEIGNAQSAFTNTTYAAMTNPKYYQYDQDQFFPTAEASGDVEFHATLSIANSADTVSAQLYNRTNSTTVAEVSLTGTTSWTLATTTNVDADADWDTANDDEYEVQIKCTDGNGGGCSGSIANAKLVFTQSSSDGIISFETMRTMTNTLVTDADTTYSDSNYPNAITPANHTGATYFHYSEATMKTSAGTGYAQLRNDSASSAISGSEIQTTNASYERKRTASSVSAPLASHNIDTQIKNSATNTTSVANSWLVSQAHGILNRPTYDLFNVTNGAIYGASWQSEDICLVGKCLMFDGSDDAVFVPNISQIDLNAQLAAGFTFQAWVRVNSDGENSVGRIFSKGANTYIRTTNEGTDGYVDLEASVGLASNNATVTVTNGLKLNTWHHVAMAYTDDGDDEITVYIDGKATASTDGSGSPSADTTDLMIGGSSAANFDGFIDEAKVYKQERTGAQIATDVVRDAGTKGAAASFGKGSTEFLSSGLVGYWKMDENTGSTISDSSGNGSTSSTFTGDTTWVSGKYGSSLTFDGVDDVVRIPESSATDLGAENTSYSVSIWINTTFDSPASDQILMTKFSGNTPQPFDLKLTSLETAAFVINSSTVARQSTFTSRTLNDGQWHHIVGVRDAQRDVITVYVDGVAATPTSDTTTGSIANDADISIGAGSTSYTTLDFTGSIDDARIYNRALSDREILDLYAWAPGPVAYYDFDHTDTTTVYDTSGNGRNGTVSGNPTFGTGKYGKGIEKTAYVTANYVSIADDDAFSINTTNKFTAMAWVKINNRDGWNYVLSKRAGSNYEWHMAVNPLNSQAEFLVMQSGSSEYMNAQISSYAFAVNTWYHIAAVADLTTPTLDLYVNGVKVASDTTSTGSYTNGAEPVRIASSGDGAPLGGSVDEVKFYNYTRTSQQIVEDMNAGHPTGGSPISSQTIYWSFDEQHLTTANNRNTAQSSLTGSLSGTKWLTNTHCKINGCLYFDSTTDYVSGGDVSFTDSLTGFSASFWIYPNALATNRSIISKNDTNQKQFAIVTNASSSDEIRVHIADTITEADNTNYFVTSNLDLSVSTWTHILVTYDAGAAAANRIRVYKNGSLRTGSAAGTIPSDGLTSGSTSNLKVGDDDSGTYSSIDAYIDEVKLYSDDLTVSQVAIDYNANASMNFSVGTLEASKSADGAGNPPIAYWPLDENTGSNAYDKSGNGLNGTLENSPSWTRGKVGQALYFEGENDRRVAVADNDLLDPGTGSMTIQAWVKHGPNDATADFILTNYVAGDGDGGYGLNMQADGTLRFGIDDDGASFPEDSATSVSTYDDNQWHFVVGVKTGTSKIDLYVDGIWVDDDAALDAINSISSSDTLYIGTLGDGTSQEWKDGYIDDVKYYNYARTQAQIIQDFNRGAPYAWWKFDECTGTVAYDSAILGSGAPAGVNGTITPAGTGNTAAGTCTSGDSAHMWYDGATGKRNASLGFDGVNDTVNLGDASRLSFEYNRPLSISLWMKKSAGEGNYVLVNKQESSVNYRGWNLQTGSSGYIFFQLVNTYPSNAIERRTTRDTNYDDNSWHHIVATYDGSGTVGGMKIYFDGRDEALTTSITGPISATMDNAVPAYIGSRNNAELFYPGLLDDVRIYNYVLSADQVKNIMQGEGGGARFGPEEGSP